MEEEEVRKDILRTLSYPDKFFLKGADGTHLDQARYRYLLGKRGTRSAAEKADCASLGISFSSADYEDGATAADGSNTGMKRGRK
jgi:hypothetical protein